MPNTGVERGHSCPQVQMKDRIRDRQVKLEIEISLILPTVLNTCGQECPRSIPFGPAVPERCAALPECSRGGSSIDSRAVSLWLVLRRAGAAHYDPGTATSGFTGKRSQGWRGVQ